ncbi:hypothetical protein AVEN_254494-1 [Araneus ventricosus]|uniref:Uncharacterized protein n=1 Tax=Araneus ventricosus TaxID=182803 RepID=A0A4Y2LT30_ARAVE|nr:hypothetical protein AVEN_254494-1 [Araneus ventricosus]
MISASDIQYQFQQRLPLVRSIPAHVRLVIHDCSMLRKFDSSISKPIIDVKNLAPKGWISTLSQELSYHLYCQAIKVLYSLRKCEEAGHGNRRSN